MVKSLKITIIILIIFSISIGEKESLLADIPLEEIKGVVVNDTTGQPITATTITLYIEQLNKDSEVFYATTDNMGSFIFENIEIK